MTTALEAHEINKATLNSVQAAIPNPLLARGKLKKAPKPKSKSKKNLASSVQQAKTSELQVIEADSDAVAGAEEAEVLDLADQLLAQLDGQLEEKEGLAVPTEPLQKSTSASSSGSAREKLHDMKEGVKDMFHSNSEDSATTDGEPKVSRQKLRKVSSGRPTFGSELIIASDSNGKSNTTRTFGSRRKRRLPLRMIAQSRLSEMPSSPGAQSSRFGSRRSTRMDIGEFSAAIGLHFQNSSSFPCSLYSAIADQANGLGLSVSSLSLAAALRGRADVVPRIKTQKETYASTRAHAADYMRSHPDDFLPFLTSDENPEGVMSPGESFRPRSILFTDLIVVQPNMGDIATPWRRPRSGEENQRSVSPSLRIPRPELIAPLAPDPSAG